MTLEPTDITLTGSTVEVLCPHCRQVEAFDIDGQSGTLEVVSLCNTTHEDEVATGLTINRLSIPLPTE